MTTMLRAIKRRRPSAKVALLGVGLAVLAWSALPRAWAFETVEAARLRQAEDAVSIKIADDTGERIVIDYKLGEFTESRVGIGRKIYKEIVLGQESVMKEVVGAPELPHVCRSIIIPNDAEMVAHVLKSDYYEISDVDVPPSKGVISRKVNPADVPYTFGKEYDTNAFYPSEVVALRKPYVLRDYRGVVVKLHPFQYNPVTRTLRVYTSVTVEVVKTRAGKVNVKNRPFRPDDVSLAFHKIYRGHFLNYETETTTRYTPLGETGDMLIIYYDDWASNIQPLVDHKNNSMGISTAAVAVGTIGNNSTSIANYIQNAYDTGDLAFVLLVGDEAQVATPSASGGASDPTYSKVAGSDDYPDIAIGRFSAQSAAEVDTQVLRTIEYETMPATQQSWFKKGFGVASAEGTGDDGEYDYEHVDNIRADLLAYGYTTVDQLYATVGATDTDVTNALNAGRGIGNYCGHGSATSWGTTGFNNTDVNNLANDNMLPFIISVACNNGEFDNYTDCFGEAWLQATNGTEPTGAIGFYGSSISQSWSPPMCAQDESVDRLVDESYFSFGALCYAGSCQMMDEYGSAGVTEFNTWHVFGDPSVRVYGTGATPTCDDGILNQGEDKIDCGGPCPACNCTSDSQCSNGLFCDGAETCDDYGECQTGSDPCAGYFGCDEVNDVCIECYVDGDCDDGLFCTGTETCDANNLCQAGSDPCPGQVCDEINDICVAGPAIQYEWTMDTDPGWITQGLWAWGQPTGGGGQYGNPDPTSGYTGSNVYGYNLSGDYENSLSETHLTSAVIDCTGLSDVTLKFWRWLGVEQPSYDHAYVRVSNDGSNWTEVWTNSAAVEDSSWSQMEYDISSVADDQSTVYLRWTMGSTDGSWQFCGWNIDDIEVWAIGGGEPTCDDGIQNQGEDLIDCGGPCPPCNCLVGGDCSDGLYCNGAETCDAYGECQAGSDPCPGQLCDEGADSCYDCDYNSDCDDGLFCNGAETCVGGFCQAGSDPCPGQSCDEVNDQCVPLPELYTPAEYDDNEGMFVVWGSYTSIVTDMTVAVTTGDPDAIVYIVVTGSSQQSIATSTLTSAGADMGQVDFITYTTDTVWIRDYGPRFVVNDDVREIVDFEYNRPRPNDNGFPVFVGGLWSEVVSEMDLTHGGGNFQVVGTDAFMTTLTLEENSGMSEQDVADIIDQYFNLDLTVYDRFPSSFDATGHIDMWMLPVSDTEIIVGEYASSTGDPYTITEAAVSDLNSKGYTVYRTPGWQSGGTHYTYTNAVIMNDVVLMPTYNASQDSTALAVFQAAFPDRTIVGVDCTSIISAAGAVHCIMDHVPAVGVECTVPADCDDGFYCNGAEDCVGGSCVSGTAVDCADGVGCTDDSCNEATDSCDNVPNDASCDNGLWCDGAEWCDAVNDCQAGTAPDCDDGVGCTDDSCNEGTDSCDNVANDANCENGLWCDGTDWCDDVSDCQSGTAPDCNDGVGCTDDSCNEGTDSCDNTPNNGYCDNGLFCDGAETCHSTLDCQAGGDPCPGQICDEVNDVCCDCEFDTDCDDGFFCNGAETCDGCFCQAGTDPCPGQSCNEDTDTCETVECVDAGDCDDGSDCTVDTCVDNVCYNDCPATVDTYPYTEGFESGFGDWVNMGGDDLDWTSRSGSTPSSSTGPSSAHGGTYYIYTESSSPNYPSKTAILEGPCFDLNSTSDADLTFWYHMYGSGMGTLDVEVSEDCVSWTNVWSLAGDQGDTWYEAGVDLSAYVGKTIVIRFYGITGSSYTSDMAVDDIAVDVTPAIPCNSDPECNDGVFCNGAEVCVGNFCQPGTDPCPGQACDEDLDTCFTAECTVDGDCDDLDDCTVDTCVDYVCVNECPITVASFPYSEGFESGWGDWVNSAADGMDWSRYSGSTPSSNTGPSGAHGGTYYIYTESSSPNYPSVTGIIDGPCFDLTSASDTAMTFWYHMYGTGMGTLYLEASEDCATWSTVWSLFGNQGNAWYQANVDLSAYDGTRLSLRFRGVTGSSYTSDMSVDDITITATVGPTCTVPADCDDGLYCNGAEDCVGGNCVAGTAVNCNDGVGCTDDTCNEGTHSCDNVANDANCDNGQWCDGAEWCDDVSDCQDGTAPDCTDAVPCTVDSCNEGTDSCDNTPDDGYCDDGVYCNGAETCDAGAGCLPGANVDCDDGVGCTDDSCNEGTDSCDNIANDAYCPDNGLFCDGDEFCDAVADCSSTGDPCDPGDICNETTNVCDPGGGGAQMEAGSVSIGGTPVTVTLTNTYASAVVVCSAQYSNNTTPVVPRVTNVGSTSFDVYLQNPSGGAVATETVNCIVVEEGTWTIDGVNIEAQKYLSTVTDQNNSWIGEAQTYGQAYTNPVVLGQVMSDNDAMWSVFWCQGTARTNPPVASALKTGKTVAEDTDTTRANETVGLIVFEAGHGTIGGVAFEALLGSDTILGVTNAPPYTYTFNTAFASAPSVAVVTMAGVDGGNGGWAYTYGASPTSATTLDLVIDEDQIGDVERNHTSEQVGYVVFESAVTYP